MSINIKNLVNRSRISSNKQKKFSVVSVYWITRDLAERTFQICDKSGSVYPPFVMPLYAKFTSYNSYGPTFMPESTSFFK